MLYFTYFIWLFCFLKINAALSSRSPLLSVPGQLPANLASLFSFLDAKHYIVAVLLANCHCCLYGDQHTTYFDCVTPTLEEYLENLN